MWDITNATLAELYKLKRLIDYKMAGQDELPEAEVDQLFKELDRVLTKADMAWVKTYVVK